MKDKPPLLARKLLQLFVHVHYQEEVEGDLEEVFHNNIARNGRGAAWFCYWVHVFRAIRFYPAKRSPSNILNEISHFVFLKLAFRNIWKRKCAHTVNVLGLTAAMVSFMAILHYTRYEKSFDRFHTHADRIARVGFDWGEVDEQGDNNSIYASNVPAMGHSLAAEIPEIETYTTFVPVETIHSSCYFRSPGSGAVIEGGHGLYVDDRFLSIFSFPVRVGDARLLADPNTIAITASFAGRIFGREAREEVIGKGITVLTDKEEHYTIAAVLDDVPSNSHIAFDYLISYATINTPRLGHNIYWSQFYTYVLLRDGKDIEAMTAKLAGLVDKIYGKDSRVSLFSQALTTIHLTSNFRGELGTPGSQSAIRFLTVIGYVVLLIGWVNFTNLFLSHAVERVREVGIKKAMGSTRIQLMVQFLSESALINFISIVFSVLTYILILPYLASWTGVTGVDLPVYSDAALVIVILFVMGSLVTGVFPAWMLSSYKPLRAMGKQAHDLPSYLLVKNGLVYFQLIVCFTVVASGWIMKRQLTFMQQADLGISLEQSISLRLPSISDATTERALERLKQKVGQYPLVDHVTTSSAVPGTKIIHSGGVQRTGPSLEGNNVLNIYTDEGFISTFGITLLAGSNFNASPRDSIHSVLLNKEAVRVLKFETPEASIGEIISWQERRVRIVGVFKNYNHLFLKVALEPLMLTQAQENHSLMTVKFTPSTSLDADRLVSFLREHWLKDVPFDFFYTKDHYGDQYRGIRYEYAVIQGFAMLALLICAIGLFSISGSSIQKRFKEIAVRKVLGAGTGNILALLLLNRIPMILLSALVGTVVTFVIITGWLETFAFAVSLHPADFLFPLLIISTIVLIAIGYYALKGALLNPAHVLKKDA